MKLAIIGYGKLGKAVVEIAVQNGWDIVAKVNEGDSWSPEDWDADIVFESSTPESAVNNALKCIAAGLPIGTKGYQN